MISPSCSPASPWASWSPCCPRPSPTAIPAPASSTGRCRTRRRRCWRSPGRSSPARRPPRPRRSDGRRRGRDRPGRRRRHGRGGSARRVHQRQVVESLRRARARSTSPGPCRSPVSAVARPGRRSSTPSTVTARSRPWARETMPSTIFRSTGSAGNCCMPWVKERSSLRMLTGQAAQVGEVGVAGPEVVQGDVDAHLGQSAQAV